MSEDNALASRLFPGAAAEAAEGKQQPAQTRDPASRLFPGAAAEEQEGKPEQQQQKPKAEPAKGADQQKPAQDGKGEQPKPEAVTKAATEIATTLAESAGLDPAHEDTSSFSTLASELGISKEGAVRLAEWDADRNSKAWDRQFEIWNKATYAEFLNSELEDARNVIMEHGDQELDDLLNGPLGLGSHPALVRFIRNVARARRGGR